MRVVAAGDTFIEYDRNKRYLTELNEGIIIFSENSLNKEEDGADWTIRDLAEFSRKLNMTIVGEARERIQIIMKGKITSAQRGFAFSEEELNVYRSYDQLYDVSYDTRRKIWALSRICADGDTPFEGKGMADLLLIPSGGIDWEEEGIERLLDAHHSNLSNNALIVQCDQHLGNKFIYSLRDGCMVGEKKTGEQGNKYITHNI